MNQSFESPTWWRYLARSSLNVTIVVVFAGIMSLLFAKTGFLGIFGFNDRIGFVFNFALSFYVSVRLALLAIIGLVTGFFLKYQLKQYVTMFIISLIPIVLFYVVV